MKLSTKIILFLVLLIVISSFTCKQNKSFSSKTFYCDTIKKDSVLIDSTVIDSVKKDSTVVLSTKHYKTNAHASYYHDKFTGRKTASGAIFDNKKFTAAHRKLKFGTKVRVTNIANSKSVIVTINDRGPFVKGREIDLSKAAFMSITAKKGSGTMLVNIEIIE
ncbi:MAG: septal ring lytic transglycosylase RlpA family protein [Flavobacterium sp.]|nr:septal ring lytic transglycosylase RlpA family protein [Flavobacterium sp.]